MKRSRLNRAGACAVALAALALCSPAAHADFGVSFGGGGGGAFTPTDPELPVILATGAGTTLRDGSFIGHVNCVPGCNTDGQPNVVDTWYKRAFLPTRAAGQAFAAYGLLKARSWVTAGAINDGETSDRPGTSSYFGQATAEWREDLIYTGSTPTTVTMQFTLHATWNDLGRFSFTIGRDTIGAENVRVIDGVSYVNCAGPIQCGSGAFGAQPVQVLGNDPDNTSGDVTLAIDYSFQLGADLVDPENPLPPLPYTFVALLQTSSIAPGAEIDAFQTATLERILVEPGAQISFASGHNWPVQVVPEPQTALLWLAGLAAIVPLARRRRAPG